MIEFLVLPLSALSVLIIMPFLVLIPIAGFTALWGFKKIKTAIPAAVLWVLYGVYETGMYLRILCSGECNIRVDLLLIYPLLLGFSLLPVITLGIKLLRKS